MWTMFSPLGDYFWDSSFSRLARAMKFSILSYLGLKYKSIEPIIWNHDYAMFGPYFAQFDRVDYKQDQRSMAKALSRHVSDLSKHDHSYNRHAPILLS